MKNLEIENKYLLSYKKAIEFIESLSEFESKNILQVYINIFENSIKRVRKIDNSYILTIKKGSGKIRFEKEKFISKKRFLKLSKRNIGQKIKKVRYIFFLDSHKYELDIFKGNLQGLAFLEIEFADKQEMEGFILPNKLKNLIIRDISSDLNYTNSSLAILPRRYKKIHEVFMQIESLNIEDNFDFHLNKNISIYDSLRVFIFYYLSLVKKYQIKILHNDEKIDLHNFRINLRKIRSLIVIFKELFDEDVYLKLNHTLKRLFEVTNAKRDLDIFIAHLNTYKMQGDILDFIDFLKKRTEEEKKKISNQIKSQETDGLMFDVDFLLREDSNFYKTKLADLKARTYIKEKIKHLWGNLNKSLNKLEIQTATEDFHHTRIKIKKMRYLIETFGNDSKKSGNFSKIKKLKRYQNNFGKLNDLSNQMKITKDYLSTNRGDKNLNDVVNKLISEIILQKKSILEDR